ncbi:hypothetical protein MHYP_G00329540 [Metynnis hypsauchen]
MPQYTRLDLLSLNTRACLHPHTYARCVALGIARRPRYIHRGSRRSMCISVSAIISEHIPSIYSSSHRISTIPRDRRYGIDLSNLRQLAHTSTTVIQPRREMTPVKIALFNARSLANKTFLLNDFFTSRSLDILFVVETWLSAGDSSSLAELSPNEETSPPPEKRGRMETHEWLTETAKDGTVWREEQIGRPLHHSPIECNPMDGEPTAFARRKVSSRLQSFLCFISLQMLRTIQEWTVQHARQTQHGNWFMDLPKLMAFIAILILRGIVRLPAVHDAWSATLGVPSISKIMARNRFQDIMRHLRFDDKDTRSERVANDRFAAVSDV